MSLPYISITFPTLLLLAINICMALRSLQNILGPSDCRTVMNDAIFFLLRTEGTEAEPCGDHGELLLQHEAFCIFTLGIVNSKGLNSNLIFTCFSR